MCSSSSRLLEREGLTDEGRTLLKQAHDSGRMLSQLLNDVLDFSKIEAGQLELTPEAMDVGEALEAVTGLLGGQARAKGVDLRCEIGGRRCGSSLIRSASARSSSIWWAMR